MSSRHPLTIPLLRRERRHVALQHEFLDAAADVDLGDINVAARIDAYVVEDVELARRSSRAVTELADLRQRLAVEDPNLRRAPFVDVQVSLFGIGREREAARRLMVIDELFSRDGHV